ncbi:MAG: CBS domain-containing protein [Candidatus Hydrothermarchaeales archaeon]
MDTEVRVKEAMTQGVITLSPDAPVNEAAKLMAEKGIGSIVIAGEKPEGIVTERDICYHVVAKDKRAAKVRVRDIMSSPLKTVPPEMTITDASRMMAKHNIRRLPVLENDILIGLISNKDIIAIAPETIEILQELSRMNSSTHEDTKADLGRGTCEVCGGYMVTITEVNGTYVCESCKEDMLGGD